MKKTISNIVKLIVFLSITVFLIIVLGKAFTPTGWKDNYQGQIYTIKGIEEIPNNSIDVLFLGASSFQKSISPMQVYEETGISSYNYSISSARIYMMYYFLQDILKTQKPKVVMVDIITLFYKSREEETEQRKSFDYNDLDLIKLKMINDDVFDTTFEEKASYIFPLLRYHSRWDELKIREVKDSFARYESNTRGFLMSNKLKSNHKGWSYMQPSDKKVFMQDYVSEYFYKFVELCKKNDIEVVFVGIPDVRAWNYASSKEMAKLAKETNTVFLDLNDEVKCPLDWLTDTEDGGYHMNIKGAQKITHAISKFFNENYKFNREQTLEERNYWNKNLIIYNNHVEQNMKILNRRIKENN